MLPPPGPAVVVPATPAIITYDTNLPGFVEDPPADPPFTIVDQGGVVTFSPAPSIVP